MFAHIRSLLLQTSQLRKSLLEQRRDCSSTVVPDGSAWVDVSSALSAKSMPLLILVPRRCRQGEIWRGQYFGDTSGPFLLSWLQCSHSMTLIWTSRQVHYQSIAILIFRWLWKHSCLCKQSIKVVKINDVIILFGLDTVILQSKTALITVHLYMMFWLDIYQSAS